MNYKVEDFTFIHKDGEWEVEHGEYSCYMMGVLTEDLYSRIDKYIRYNSCQLWTDGDPEEASTRVYVMVVDAHFKLIDSLEDLVYWLRTNKDIFELNIEDGLV